MQVLHSYGRNYDKAPVEFVGNCFIGLTNKRLFKIENDNMGTNVFFKDMISCDHASNTLLFKWDSLFIQTHDKTLVKVGICQGKTAAYFNHYINHILKELQDREISEKTCGSLHSNSKDRTISVTVQKPNSRYDTSSLSFLNDWTIYGVTLGCFGF